MNSMLVCLLLIVTTDKALKGWCKTSDSDIPFNAPLESDSAITQRKTLNTSLNHLIVDRNTGRVFVGAVNRLYQLSPDLDIQTVAVTGPQNDWTETDTVTTLTNNYNKVLLIDYSTGRLITCGSLFQGVCTVRNLQNASIVEQEIQEAVAANTETASTVAFIGPGPPAPPVTNVMYVGVTFTLNSPYRSEIPAVSSRSLESTRLFQIASASETTGTRMFINSYARKSYIVDYVYGFSSNRFSYFLTTQLKHNFHVSKKEYITKLVRVCQEDSNYYSYTEVPVNCLKEGINYNLVRAAYLGKAGADLAEDLGITPQEDVLYTVFSVGEEKVPTNRSALCVYPLKAIRQKFMQNIKSCFNGNGARGLDFIAPNMNCVPTKLQTISEDFCGLDFNSPLGGEQPIVSVPVILISHQLTAVAVTRTSGYTVVFIGTLEGHLKKIEVESAKSAIEYADIIIDEGSKVNADMHFDAEELNLYVMTNNKVAKVKVHDCTVFRTCSDCLGARDPYCGWCLLQDKCNLQSNCQGDNGDSMYWIDRTNKCVTLMNVSTNKLQRTTTGTVELEIEHLQALKEDLTCAFTSVDRPPIFTKAARKGNMVNCTTPATDLLPEIDQGKHHFTTKLSVRTVNGSDLVSTNFTFFDCATHLSCTRCVSSQFPCNWCIVEHRCTHDSSANCRNDTMVTGVWRIQPSFRSGSEFCPSINAASDGAEILVAHGSIESIDVKVRFIEQFMVQAHFQCQLNIEGKVINIRAQRRGDSILCDPMEFVYSSKSPTLTVGFAIVWGVNKVLDNPNNVHVVIYRCRAMCDSCGTCLTLPAKYNCVWCQSTSTCEVPEKCLKNVVDMASKHTNKFWLNRQQTCPNIEIISFEPNYGPWEGTTNITIRGNNLGKNFADVQFSVTAAGIRCVPYRDLYVIAKEIVCNVARPDTQQHRRGKIEMKIDGYRGQSTYDYQFVNPQIEDFYPKHGPIAGGTEITITGKYLLAGSRIQIFIGDQECKVIFGNDTHANFRTSSSKMTKRVNLKMTFDNIVREFYGEPFEYVNDPVIESVASPKGTFNIDTTTDSEFLCSKVDYPHLLQGFPAGGLSIAVVGNHFQVIQKPRIIVIFDLHKYFGHCEVISNTDMICKSPIFDAPEHLDRLRHKDPNAPIYLEYGFDMDSNVIAVNNQMFELYPNPFYYPFEGTRSASEYLTLYGRNLNLACKDGDVVVTVGNGNCIILSLTRERLICRPPTESIDGNEEQIVIATVGNLEYKIGVLTYASPEKNRAAFYLVILGATVFALLFLFLIISYMRLRVRSQKRAVANVQFEATVYDDENCTSHQDNPSYNMPYIAGAFSKATFNANVRQTNNSDYDQSYEEPIYYEIPEQPPDAYDRLSYSKRNPISQHYNQVNDKIED